MAPLALIIWLVAAPFFFASLPAVPALLWAVLVPYLFLPEAFGIDLPGLPDIDKTSAITVGLVAGFLFYRDKFEAALKQTPTILASPGFKKIILLCLCLIGVSIFGSVLNNQEPLRFGPTYLPGMRPWDIVSAFGSFLFYITPFFFARRYLATPEMHRALLRVLVIMGLAYSMLMLIEFRLSPQLHNWVYGYHQHSWIQHIRDGYRPKVFLQHGLWVGFFMFQATVAAAALWRIEKTPQLFWMGVWLFFILMISRNLGAFAVGLLALAAFFGMWSKMQVRIGLVVALAIVFYPMLRQAQVIPLEQILDVAGNISEDRAGSLLYRLDNEDALLERAFDKPLTGWGGYARDRIYNEAGVDISISEGRWIQTIGTRGWIGYVGLFGLLSAPLLFLPFVRRRKTIPPETIALALIIVGNLIYMVPNSTLTPVSWLIFGALAGFVQYDSVAQKVEAGEVTEAPESASRYTRFPRKDAMAEK